MENIAGLKIQNHQASPRLVDIKIKNDYLDQVKQQFDQHDLIDIEYKPFLRFHITDIFNKVFDEKIQNLFKHILTNREQGAFVIGPESMDEN
jgi:protein CsiD